MLGRPDARQYATGAKKLLNYQPLPQGPATRRAGTQHVAAANNHALERRLIPFVFSTDQALVVEMIQAKFRFHTNGRTLLHTARKNIGETGIDTSGTNVITFEEEHGFASNDKIRITWPIVATIPTGLARGTDYYVIVVDSYRIQVSASSGPGVAIGISGTAAGYARAWLADDFPVDYDIPSVGSTTYFDHVLERVDFVGHPYQVGDAIRFRGAASPVWATLTNSGDLVAEDTTYYVSEVGTDWFKFALTEGGDSELLSPPSSGTFTTHRWYRKGDLMYWAGGGSPALDPGVYYCDADHEAVAAPGTTPTNWSRQWDDGTLTVPTGYSESQLAGITYAQSNDIVTLTQQDNPPRELRRLGATTWDIRNITFGSTEAVPTGLAKTEDRGAKVTVGQATTTHSALLVGAAGTTTTSLFNFDSEHGLAPGDAVYIEVIASAGSGLSADGYYVTDRVSNASAATFKDLDGNPPVYVSNSSQASLVVYYASLSADNSQNYKVTAVNNDGVESIASAPVTATNNLDVAGASNALTWSGSSPKYRIYREENGLYGYIGESDTAAFTDDGIAPDLSRTPPIADTDISGSDWPRACGYYEQRRAFGGTIAKPRQLWMTKSGTESDLTYSLPIKDDDRISVGLAAREAATIRHIVPMADMILLTQQGEWRVTAINSDAITPETVAVRQQSEIGASTVRPLVVNNTVVFTANRGGHVRTMSFNWQAQGYITGDLSLRATHLFDGLTIKDSTYSKAPYPVLWFVSSSGKLLSLTYVPEEEVAGWAVHDVGGTVESVCAIPEGDQDSVYIAVKRTVNGAEERHIERIVPHVTENLTDNIYMDAAVTYDGLEASGRTITLTGGTKWDEGETVTVTASAHLFKDRTEVGDEIELHDTSGGKYRVRIKSYVSSTVVSGHLLNDVPTALHRVGVTTWAFARKTIAVGSHLEGATVDIVSDGVVQTPQIVAGGVVTLPVAGAKVHVGHNYVSEIETLPVTMQQIPGAGRGRVKNVSKVDLRVLESAGLKVGPDADKLVPVEGMDTSTLSTGEVRAVPAGKWGPDGEIVIRQDQPRPSTVLGLVLDVELGD
jgi:hypothetical protein